MRDFERWLSTMTDTVADWTYYTNFPKVFNNVNEIKIPLNLLNSLIGSQNIRQEFISLIEKYPEVLKVVPIIIAKRIKDTIIIKTPEKDFYFNFKKIEYSNEEYADFLEKTGIFDLLQNRIIGSLVDYITGVEVGLDSNGRKNRTGHAMENLVENFLKEYEFDYYKEMYQDDVEQIFNVDLSNITNNGTTKKRFDFVTSYNGIVYLIEVNFYSSGGSKLNETARSYKMITEEVKEIPNVEFVWFTDGKGWNSARNNLRETFEVLPTLFNINDCKNGALEFLKKEITD